MSVPAKAKYGQHELPRLAKRFGVRASAPGFFPVNTLLVYCFALLLSAAE